TIGGEPVLGNRVVPDVAFLADPDTGVNVYTASANPLGDTGWEEIGGTSLASPMFAATVSLANQLRTESGIGLIGGNLNQDIYNLGYEDQDSFFNDITTGSNGFPALTGFDEATGWGSPKGETFVDALAGEGITSPPPGFIDSTFNWSATFYASNAYPDLFGVPDTASWLGTGTVLGDQNFLATTMTTEGAPNDGFYQINGDLSSNNDPLDPGVQNGIQVLQMNVGANGAITGAGVATGVVVEVASPTQAAATSSIIFTDLPIYFQGQLTSSGISGTFYTVEGLTIDPITGAIVPGPRVPRGGGGQLGELEGTFN
ncbi:MAG TPA: hypothetical protein VMD30_12305, partial [Tepidisphaeraceae bacterium]|nr:hypothetical protein [Tepidisphaeraceae bacterium]